MYNDIFFQHIVMLSVKIKKNRLVTTTHNFRYTEKMHCDVCVGGGEGGYVTRAGYIRLMCYMYKRCRRGN